MSRALPPRPVAQGRVAGVVFAGVAAATLAWAAAEATLYPTKPHTFTPAWAAASAKRAAAAGMSPFRHWGGAPLGAAAPAAAAADAARTTARVRAASARGYAHAH